MRLLVEAFISSQPRRRGKAFLERLALLAAEEESMAQLRPIRPATAWTDNAVAAEEVAGIVQEWTPALVAVLPRE